MNIHRDDPKWTAYVLGELSDAERAEVERELESAVEAREIVDEICMMTTLLKDELAKEAPVSLHPEQRAAITRTMSGGPARWRMPRWMIAGAGVAVAAMLLLTISIPSFLRSRQSATSLPRAVPPAVQSAQSPTVDSPTARLYSEDRSSNKEKDAPAAVAEQRAKPEDRTVDKKMAATDEIQPMILKDSRGLAASTGKLPQSTAPQNTLNYSQPVLQYNNQQTRSGPSNAAQNTPSIAGDAEVMKSAGAGGRGGFAGGVLVPRAKTAVAPAMSPPPPAPGARVDNLRRPDFNTEAYDRIEDNAFKTAAENPLATFSIDVDTAAYANMRRFLNQNQLPPKDSVRIEELINYFNYDYAQPTGQHPIAVHTEVAAAPWRPEHRLVRIGIKAKDIDLNNRPPSNLVFLIDVSGSMMPAERLPLLKSSLKLLVDKLTENDRVAMVVYAGRSGLVLPSTTGDKKEVIVQALDRLEAGGSTNGASGIQLAYNTAVAGFIKGGVNRVILCTDGDFNVGVTNQGDLTRLIEDKAKSGVFLSVLGFGMGNLKDSTMEKLADKGNGNYAYIDSLNEGRKVLVEEMGGTLMTVAKDVKIQVDFNPAQANAYRLIGYENRVLQNQDFNDDTKDAGDMGAGHTVTALFEIVPRAVNIATSTVDPSKYQQPAAVASERERKNAGNSNELLTVRVRYKQPDADVSVRFDVPLVDRRLNFDSASVDFRFASAVAEFGMILRDSPHKGSGSLDHAIRVAEGSKGSDRYGYREEFVRLVRKARALKDLQ